MDPISPSIFRAYDVRGLYPTEMNADAARRIANALVRFLKAKVIIVGEDGRTSSSELRQAVCAGVTAAGADVWYIGQCTTPMFYFASKQLAAQGAIMVTASHNPREYNGLKIMQEAALPLGVDEGLYDVRDLAQGEYLQTSERGRVIEKLGFINEYMDFLVSTSGLQPGMIGSTVAIDAGNGVAGITLKPLFDRLKISTVPLNLEVDGSFPNRSPDPIVNNGMNGVRQAVVQNDASVGFSFDGDADRVAVVDEHGKLIEPQVILALLWQSRPEKSKVVYELRFSRAVREIFGGYGIRSKVGHTHIVSAMRAADAWLGGETSGHFFFKEMNYIESSELATLFLLKLLQETGKPLSMLAFPLEKYAYSGEVGVSIETREAGEQIIQMLSEKYVDAKQDFFDGLTVEYDEWWFNIRPSNTEPALRLVVEAQTKNLLDEKVEEVHQAVRGSHQ